MTERAGAPPRDGGVVALLWLAELQRVAGRGAHAIRNALNGVVVNLEVVRGRAARADASGASLSRFADSAAEQLERVMTLSEALLTLARPPRDPADVRATALDIHALLREGHTGGEGLVNGTRYEGPAITGVPGQVVRLALAHVLLPAADDQPPAEWSVEETGRGAERALAFRVRRQSPAESGPDDGVEAVVQAEGVRIERGARTLSLIFPGLAP